MMKLAILGATGATGQQLIKQALEKGHDVTAVVRNIDKMKITNDKLKVVKGNIFNEDSMTEVLEGHDAVMSCLGFPRNPRPVTGYSKSGEVVITAMRKNNIKRFIVMSSWFTDITSGHECGFIVRRLVVPFLKPLLDDMRILEMHLENSCADIDYTVVRPPQLSNGLVTNKAILAVEGFYIKSNQASSSISRADVARYMLSNLETEDLYKKMVSITASK